MKKKAVYVLLFITIIGGLLYWIFQSAFTVLPTAVSLLRMPEQDDAYTGLDTSELKRIQSFLPTGASLVAPLQGMSGNKIIKEDINEDGNEELIYCYRLYGEYEEVNLAVLSFLDGSWKRILYINKDLLDFDSITFSDLTGDGKPEVLLSWKKKGQELRGLDIYTYNTNKLVNIYSTSYSKLGIDDQRDKRDFGDRDKLIIWKENGIYYDVDVMAWDTFKFVSISEDYPEDYIELVNHYEEQEDKLQYQKDYWYHRAYANMMAGKYSKAINFIDKAIPLETDQNKLLLYKLIKSNCQVMQGKDNQAELALLNIISEISKIPDLIAEKTLLADAYYYLGKYYYKNNAYNKARDMFIKTENIYKALYKDNEIMYQYKIYVIVRSKNQAASLSALKENKSKIH